MASPNDPRTREWTSQETSVAIYSHEDLCSPVFIAEGGMGAVCRYRNKKLGHDVVVKTCKNLSLEEEKNLMEEAKLQLSSATHINIVRLLGFVVLLDSSKGIMLEYMKEGSFHQVIHETSGKEHYVYTRANIIGWSAEIASALYFLHSTGLKHLDLKPNNILMFSNRLSVKIADFGISKFESDAETGFVKGSRCFMAPETFTSGSCCKSDVFSYAIVLWMMIYRDSNPYKRSNGAVRELGLEFHNEFKRGLRPHIDDSLEEAFREVIVRCWADVSDRWNSQTLLAKFVVMRDECSDPILAPRLERFHRKPTLPLAVGTPHAENETDQSTSGLFGSMNLHMTSCSLRMSEKNEEKTARSPVSYVEPPQKADPNSPLVMKSVTKSFQDSEPPEEVYQKKSPSNSPEGSPSDSELFEHMKWLQAQKGQCKQKLEGYHGKIQIAELQVENMGHQITSVQSSLQGDAWTRFLGNFFWTFNRHFSDSTCLQCNRRALLEVKLIGIETYSFLDQIHEGKQGRFRKNIWSLQSQIRSDKEALELLRGEAQQAEKNMVVNTQAIKQTKEDICRRALGESQEEPSTLESAVGPICVRRLKDDDHGFSLTSKPQQLHFSVSHRMQLDAVEMYGSVKQTNYESDACITITGTSISDCHVCEFKMRQAKPQEISRIVELSAPLEVLPNDLYLMELRVTAGDIRLRAGNRGKRRVDIPIRPGRFVTFIDCLESETNVSKGQFPALYFTVF